MSIRKTRISNTEKYQILCKELCSVQDLQKIFYIGDSLAREKFNLVKESITKDNNSIYGRYLPMTEVIKYFNLNKDTAFKEAKNEQILASIKIYN